MSLSGPGLVSLPATTAVPALVLRDEAGRKTDPVQLTRATPRATVRLAGAGLLLCLQARPGVRVVRIQRAGRADAPLYLENRLVFI